MAETNTNRAKELLDKALKHCPENSTGRLAVLGAGFALLEVRAELASIRSDIAAVAKAVKDSTIAFNPGPTLAALAGDVPDGCRISQCRSCDAPVIWVKTMRGNKMPLDAKPVADGFGVREGVASKAFPGTNYESHFATCPDADQHRKPREGKC